MIVKCKTENLRRLVTSSSLYYKEVKHLYTAVVEAYMHAFHPSEAEK